MSYLSNLMLTIRDKLYLKIHRYYRNNKGIAWITFISVIAIFFYIKSGKDQLEELAQLGTFITGIGIMITALQFAFQDKIDRRGQIQETLEISDKLKAIDIVLESLNISEKDDKNFISNIKDAMVLFHRISLLLEHELIDFDELWTLSGQTLGRVLVTSIKTCLEFHGTFIAEENNLTDEFIFRYQKALIKMYQLLAIREAAMEIFQEETRKLINLKRRQEYLTTFIRQ